MGTHPRLRTQKGVSVWLSPVWVLQGGYCCWQDAVVANTPRGHSRAGDGHGGSVPGKGCGRACARLTEGAEAPNSTPKGTMTVRDRHRAENSPPHSAGPVGSAPGSSNPFGKGFQQLPNPASPSTTRPSWSLPLSEGNLLQLPYKIVL